MEDINRKELLLEKEITKKEKEISGLESKNKVTKLTGGIRVFMYVGMFILEIFFIIYLLDRWGIVSKDELLNTSGYSQVEEKEINVAILEVNKGLNMKYVNTLIEKMESFKEDELIKEVLIKMNCPGGSPVSADEFTYYIKEFNKTKKINMYVQGMAASGGYYIASAIKPIVANQNAIVGSIGVIMPKYTIKKLAETIGVEEDNVVVGDYKVPATLFKNVTEDQKTYLKENMLMPTYNNFMNVVAENRDINLTKLEKYAQGKIFIANKKSIQGVLVDEIKNLTQFKIEIKERLAKENNIKPKDVRFIKSGKESSGFPLFNIELDMKNIIEKDNLGIMLK